MRPALPFQQQSASGRRNRQRADAQRRLFVTVVQGALCVVWLCGLLGYAFLEGQLLYFRRSVLAFNPNVVMGKAEFKLLRAEFFNWPGGPACIRRAPELLLIQTTATRFEELIAYSHRLASPNDHDLMVVFVRDTVAGQPWKTLAKDGFPTRNNRPVVPPNWVAELTISQPGGMPAVNGCRVSLLDLQALKADAEVRSWNCRLNYDADSLTEQVLQSSLARPMQVLVVSRHSRRLLPIDAAYYSPYRRRVRQWYATDSSSAR